MLNRTLLTVGVLALGLTAARGAEPQASDPAAEKLMKDAHLARSGWDDTFPGFTAKLTVVLDGKEEVGTCTVKPDGGVLIKLPKGPAFDWANRQLESIVMHRQAGTREKYNVAFAEESGVHPLGKLVKFLDSQSHSVYRLKDNVITEVHREMGKTKFTISVTDVARNAEGKYNPKAFNVSFWDGQSGDLVRNEDYQEDWVRVGKYDLPQRRLLIRTEKGMRTVGELKLSDFELTPKQAIK